MKRNSNLTYAKGLAIEPDNFELELLDDVLVIGDEITTKQASLQLIESGHRLEKPQCERVRTAKKRKLLTDQGALIGNTLKYNKKNDQTFLRNSVT